jgi:hypothetical protein
MILKVLRQYAKLRHLEMAILSAIQRSGSRIGPHKRSTGHVTAQGSILFAKAGRMPDEEHEKENTEDNPQTAGS